MRLDRQTLYLIIGGLLALAVIAGIYIWSGKKSPSKKEKFAKRVSESEDEAPTGGAENPGVFILFWATWCGNCKTVKPIFEELIEKYHSEGIEMIESAESRASSFGRFGYPTMRYYPEGPDHPENFEEYRGAREIASIEKFYLEHRAK